MPPAPPPLGPSAPPMAQRGKLLPDLAAAIAATGLCDGATVSFHHHLRNGDGVVNAVVAALAQAGLRNLHIAASSLFPVHAPLVGHMVSGVIGRITTAYVAGPVAEAISRGALNRTVILTTHGGRARALDQREVAVDVAFVAAPAADDMGNLSGRLGRAPCGTLGYPMVDVDTARHVVAVTDSLMPFPLGPIDIPQHKVDFVVTLPSIGNAGGISSGTTRPATDGPSLAIARNAADVIAASGLLVDGFAFQTGAGGISLATAQAVGQDMAARGVTGSFASGGITGFHVKMLEAGLFRALLDVQCFDLDAVESFTRNPAHLAMSAAAYAGPHVGGAVVDRLSAVVLGAAEVDIDFNVNVTTRADGMIIGGSGGHADAAQGAALTLITTRLSAAGFAKIVPRVTTVTTPGASVDVIVTEAGITVNPRRPDLIDRLRQARLPLIVMHDLLARARAVAHRPVPPAPTGRIVAVSQDRSGSFSDVIRRLAKPDGA